MCVPARGVWRMHAAGLLACVCADGAVASYQLPTGEDSQQRVCALGLLACIAVCVALGLFNVSSMAAKSCSGQTGKTRTTSAACE